MKRLLIVADMEGIAGIGHDDFWSTIKGHPLYYLKRHLLVEEVNAAIAGATARACRTRPHSRYCE